MNAQELEKLLADVTPGEWGYSTRGLVGPRSTEDDQSFGMICDEVAECTYSDGAREANARLIAIAPTLARRVIAAEKLAKAAIGVCAWARENGAKMVTLEAAIAAWEAAQ